MRWYGVSPIPVKRRVRFTKSGKTYIDAKTRADLKRVADAYDGPLYLGAVALIVRVYKEKKSLKKNEVQQFIQRADVDNVLKAIQDGLTGKAYLDDAQVTKAYIVKLPRFRLGGEWCDFAVMPAEEVAGVSVDAEIIE